jgi:hypothetical protein
VVIRSVHKKAALAEKLWDTFRSLNYYRGMCCKTYGQLGIPSQNLWLAVAETACREISVLNKHRKSHAYSVDNHHKPYGR